MYELRTLYDFDFSQSLFFFLPMLTLSSAHHDANTESANRILKHNENYYLDSTRKQNIHVKKNVEGDCETRSSVTDFLVDRLETRDERDMRLVAVVCITYAVQCSSLTFVDGLC